MSNLLRTFKERRDSDEGFTLIELMVVVLIIGILLAIAVPTFLNAQNSAKSKAATSNLRTALSSVKTVYADKQSYATADITAGTLQGAEPSLNWQAGASTEPGQISFGGQSATTFGMAVLSRLGDCYYVYDDVSATGSTKYGKVEKGTAGLTCTGAQAATSATAASPKDANW